MATSDDRPALRRLLARARGPLPRETWDSPGDLSRQSIDAMITQSSGTARDAVSTGVLRLFGTGVEGHQVPLDDVGAVAIGWQRCVQAIGAAVLGVRSSRGRIPDLVTNRTQLMLNAAPSAGSVVLRLSAASNPIVETTAGGQRLLTGEPKPLVDVSTEMLLDVFEVAEQAASTNASETLIGMVSAVGPRAATNLRGLADVLAKTRIDLDVAWFEPSAPSRRVTLQSGSAAWFRDFVTGRKLDGEDVELAGTVRTVSDIAKWILETPEEGLIPVDASELDGTLVRNVRVGQEVNISAVATTYWRPDGSTRTNYRAVALNSGPVG